MPPQDRNNMRIEGQVKCVVVLWVWDMLLTVDKHTIIEVGHIYSETPKDGAGGGIKITNLHIY